MRHLRTLQLAPLRSGMRRLGHGFRTAARSLLDLALPPRCMQCEADLPPLGDCSFCLPCTQALAPELGACCPRCGTVLPEAALPGDSCLACKDFILRFDAAFPLGRYDGLLREAVLKTKRGSGEAMSLALGRLMAERLREKLAAFGPQAIVPVPMHWRRRLVRGGNSPELFAECLGRAMRIPVVRMLARRQYTYPQKERTPGERFRNLCGALVVRRWHRDRCGGARLLVVDDIMTTGATCSDAARALKQAGAAAVAVAIIARADGKK